MHEPAGRVLIIPGLDGNTELWRRVAPTVLPGLRPLWFDHSRDRANDGLDGLARRALALLDADVEGDAPAYLCGESFGGPIALTLARRYPDRVRGLMLISTFAYHPSRPALQAGIASARLLGDRLTHRMLQLSHPLTLTGALGIDAPKHLRRAYLRRPLADVAAYRAKCELILRFDARPWLHEVRTPTLVLAGVDDRVVPPSAGLALARGLPRARFHSLPGRHLVWCGRSAHVGDVVGDWLQRMSLSRADVRFT